MLDRAAVKKKRLKAWSRFLSDKTERRQVELVEMYRPMIEWMAWNDYNWRTDLEDIAECGMLGVLEATEKIDVKKVKSVDAYVAMVARSRMMNYIQKRWNEEPMEHTTITLLMEKALWQNLDIDLQVDLGMALRETVELPELSERLSDYKPLVMENTEDTTIRRFKNGEISIREVSRILGVSRRQACKLLGRVYPSQKLSARMGT